MATASRYATTPTNATNTPVSTNATSTGSGLVNTTNQSNTTSNQNSNTSSSGTSNTNNMTPANQAALSALIQALLSGGTPDQQQQNAQRVKTLNDTRSLQAGYSKDAAFGDAQGAMAQSIQQTLEKILPTIVRSSEGAGTSQSSLRALLTQQAATQAAQAASALGLQASTAYGGISANLANTLDSLTKPNDVVQQDLLSALGIAKGAIQNTKTTNNSTTNVSGSSQTNSVGTQQNTTQGNVVTDVTPTPVNQVAPTTTFGSNTNGVDLGALATGLSNQKTSQALSDLFDNNGFSNYNF